MGSSHIARLAGKFDDVSCNRRGARSLPGIFNQLNQAAALYAGIKPGVVLMTDGYEAYNDVAVTNQLVHLECWTHARRYMIEVEENLPKALRGRDHPVSEFIRLIGQLFAIESRGEGMTQQERLLVRKRENRSMLEQIETLLLQQLHAVLPQK